MIFKSSFNYLKCIHPVFRTHPKLIFKENQYSIKINSIFLIKKVQQAIHRNLKGHTVIVIAHRLSTIENADKIIVIDHGEIVEAGNHKELLRQNGLYAALVQKQMHGDNDTDSIVSKSGMSTPSLANIPLQSRFNES